MELLFVFGLLVFPGRVKVAREGGGVTVHFGPWWVEAGEYLAGKWTAYRKERAEA